MRFAHNAASCPGIWNLSDVLSTRQWFPIQQWNKCFWFFGWARQDEGLYACCHCEGRYNSKKEDFPGNT